MGRVVNDACNRTGPKGGSSPRTSGARSARAKGNEGVEAPSAKVPKVRFAYERHRPEDTTLYRVVQDDLETFLAQAETQTGSGLPRFVKDEVEAYLECGILAYGFLRVRCAECAREKLVAFSCKRRGFCPSCGARRMAGTAAVLVDRVVPRVPVRQWVLSFPIPLRILFAAHPELLTPVLGIVHGASRGS